MTFPVFFNQLPDELRFFQGFPLSSLVSRKRQQQAIAQIAGHQFHPDRIFRALAQRLHTQISV